MGVKFKSPLELSGHRAIAHTDVAQTLVVKVVTKTNAHPEYGNGSSSGYTIDGVEGAYLEFTPGNTYKFDQADSSNSGHPLRFYEDAAKTTAYTTGVTTSGTPGSSGAYTQIIPTTSTPPILYYQCSAHSLMGSYVKFGTGSQGDTYTLSATQDGNNVDVLLDAGTGTDSTLQLTAGNNITLTRNNAQEVTIASTASGGGGGTVTVQKNVYTANGSTTAFNTTSAIANENNVQVYLDGVYQSKDNYTTNASTVTMSTAPANGTSVELIHMVAIDGVIARDSFTGNGSTTAYVLSMSISDENATQVYLDGVYQSKDNYSTSGSTLTFSTAPPNGTAIEVVHIKAVNASSLNQNNFTGDGSTTAFTLSQSIDDETKTFVFIQGVYQEKSTYSISGTTLTFTTAPQNGYTVEVMAFSTITIGNQVTGTDWQSTIQTSNFTAAVGKGYFISTASSALVVTLPASPSLGDIVELVDYAGTAGTNPITITSSNNIEGSSADKALKNNFASTRLVYSDATKGWVSSSADSLAASLPDLNVDFLVVAGGAGGGSGYYAGGGGAGGLRTSFGSASGGGGSAENQKTGLLLSTNYAVTVGAGGLGSTNTSVRGANGADSVFYDITSIGGGGGGSRNAEQQGGNGGSGGGNAYNTGGAGQGTTNQGYNGAGAGSPDYGTGGGGASAVGQATSGNGGAGLAVSITGSSVTYAGGGGGGGLGSTYPVGSGGAGGGGNGGDAGNYPSTSGPGGDGTANTGGGGGGTGGDIAQGGDGGSGVVILRYPAGYFIHISGTLTAQTATVSGGTDKYTTFTGGSGNIMFKATEQTLLDYLVVAGGGGGASGYQGGGGGAGGYRASYNNEASGGGTVSEAGFGYTTGTNYTVTVGAGGTGGAALSAYSTTYGNNGSDSVFSTITSVGGGAGGSYWNGTGTSGNLGNSGNKGRDGGSGGGTGARQMNALGGGSGTTAQGYDGGGINGYASPYCGGGGGGAGAVGTTAGGSNVLGNGGTGVASTISGSSVTRAGGGGGGAYDGSSLATGGTGGGGTGGRGSSVVAPTAGTANTGGGGGAHGGNNSAGAAGGSGVVILRYPNTKTISIGSGLISATTTSGSDKITTFTAGTGTISFA